MQFDEAPPSYDKRNEQGFRKRLADVLGGVFFKRENIKLINGEKLYFKDQLTSEVREVMLYGGEIKLGDPL